MLHGILYCVTFTMYHGILYHGTLIHIFMVYCSMVHSQCTMVQCTTVHDNEHLWLIYFVKLVSSKYFCIIYQSVIAYLQFIYKNVLQIILYV